MLTPSPWANDAYSLLGESPLDHAFAITRFPTQGAQDKRELKLTLRTLATEIAKATAFEKKGLPWWKLAKFGDVRTPKNCLRHDANVIEITGGEADYDKGEITPEDAESRLLTADIAGLIYTTPSHLDPGKGNRWRVLVPFSKACSPAERERFMRRLNGIFDGELDPASFTLSQSYYAGSVIGKAPMRVILTEGRFLDHAEDLDARALAKGHTPAGSGGSSGSGGSEALIRLAAKTKYASGSEADFRSRIAGDAAASAHVAKEAQQSREHGERAIRRAWERAKAERLDTDLFEVLTDDVVAIGKPSSSLTFLNPDQCTDTPSRGYLVKGMLAPRDVGCIFGAPGAGKSLLAPRIGFAVAQGRPVFGLRTRPGKVFYVAAEDEHGMRGRVAALRERHGAADDFLVVGGVAGLTKDSPHLVELAHAVKREKPALIIIDTLAMAFPGLEENSSEAMGYVVAVARSLTKFGAAVLLIHHDTKEGGSTPRGHSVLNGALDMALHVKPKDASGVIRGTLTKNRNGSCDLDIAFRIGTQELGYDEDGDPIRTAFADEFAPGPGPANPVPAKLTKTAKAALKVLAGLVAGTKRDRVPEERWRSDCIESRLVSGSPERENRKRMFNKAHRELLIAEQIEVANGMVSLVNAHEGRLIDAFNLLPPDDDAGGNVNPRVHHHQAQPGPGLNRDSTGTRSRHQ